MRIQEATGCPAEFCSEFKSWCEDLPIDAEQSKQIARLKMKECAAINGCLFEQTVELQGAENA